MSSAISGLSLSPHSLGSLVVKDRTILADIAASLILVPIMHHEIEPILVTWNQVKRGQIPAHLGAIALVHQPRRNRITPRPKVIVVLRRITIRRDRYHIGILGLVHLSHR